MKRLALPAVDALAWEALLAGRPYEGDEPRDLGLRGGRAVPGRILVAHPAGRAGPGGGARRVVSPHVLAADFAFRRPGHGARNLLAMYRQRGKAEGHMGELMSVVNPALSSSPRPKRHYRGRPVENPGPGIDTFACNETRLLLAVFGYQIMHAQRAVLERATGTGWSLRRLLEAGAASPGPLHRLRPPDRHDRECSVAALASPGPPAPAPARTRGVAFRRPARIRKAAAKAWHPCARKRDTLVLSKPEHPCRTASMAPSWGQVIRSFVRVSRIVQNRAPQWGLVNYLGSTSHELGGFANGPQAIVSDRSIGTIRVPPSSPV